MEKHPPVPTANDNNDPEPVDMDKAQQQQQQQPTAASPTPAKTQPRDATHSTTAASSWETYPSTARTSREGGNPLATALQRRNAKRQSLGAYTASKRSRTRSNNSDADKACLMRVPAADAPT